MVYKISEMKEVRTGGFLVRIIPPNAHYCKYKSTTATNILLRVLLLVATATYPTKFAIPVHGNRRLLSCTFQPDTKDRTHRTYHDLDHLRPELPLREAVQDPCSIDPTQEACAISCRLYGPTRQRGLHHTDQEYIVPAWQI